MAKQGLLRQLYYYSICLIAFFIPFPFIYGSVAVITTTVLWLLQGTFKGTFSHLKKRKALWPMLIFYVLHAVSYFYSGNKEESLFDLQLKLVFMILPIVIGAGADVNKQWLDRIIAFFVTGITIIALFCLTDAIVLWTKDNSTWQFFYHQLVRHLSANAVYTSWYVVFSLCCLLYYPWSGRIKASSFLISLLVLFQLVFLVLLSSRTLLVVFIATALITLITRRFKTGPGEKTLFSAIFLTVLVLFFTNNPIKKRFKDTFRSSNSEVAAADTSQNATPQQRSNFELRVFIWKTGFQNINENDLWLFGSGNGDVHTLQNQKMYENGITNMFAEENRSEFYNINLHNMYLQSLFMLGIPGLICILMITILPLAAIARQRKLNIFSFFFIIAIIFMQQESVLQTQAGVLYFVFFWAIYWNTHYSKLEFGRY